MHYYASVETKEKTKKDKNEKFFELDISLDDIKKFITNPYKEREKIYLDNRFIEYSDILQLSVFESETTADALASAAQAKVSSNILFFYKANDMINNNHMKNITKELLFD